MRPVTVEFQGLNVAQIETSYTFHEKHGDGIDISRKIVGLSDPAAKVEIDEFITACWGTREYPRRFDRLHARHHWPKRKAQCRGICVPLPRAFRRRRRRRRSPDPDGANPRSRMTPKAGLCQGYYEEGYSFAPNLKIGLCRELGLNEELVTAFTIERAS